MPKPVEIDYSILKQEEFTLNKDYDLRLDSYLSRRLADYSRTLIQRLIKENYVTVNGKASKVSHKLRSGDTVVVRLPRLILPQLVPAKIPLDIIFEDEHIVAINKPAGLVVHPAGGHWHDTLVNALLDHCKILPTTDDIFRPGIIHRLDKDTSGVIIAAKTVQAHAFISRQFQKRTIQKEYHAIVEGVPRFESDVIKLGIARSKKDFKKMQAVKSGEFKQAESIYNVIERFNNYAYVRVKPITGRTHQIRVHLSAIGHPCVADPLYGKNKELVIDGVQVMSRQALHAFRLKFIHPDGSEKEFIAPLQEDMKNTLEVLRGAR